MNERLSYAVALVYTLGVLVTGMWVADPTFPRITLLRTLTLATVAVGWTVYFGWTVGPRIVDPETEDEDADEKDELDPTGV